MKFSKNKQEIIIFLDVKNAKTQLYFQADDEVTDFLYSSFTVPVLIYPDPENLIIYYNRQSEYIA